MATEEIIKDTFTQDRFNNLAEIEKELDIQVSRVETLRNTYGQGMQEGQVLYTPNLTDTYYGILESQIEVDDRTQIVKTEITDPREAYILAGLQNEIDRKKRLSK